MTNWGFDDSQDNDQGNNDNQPGGLRSFAEAQKAENKALKDQLAQIQEQLRNQSLTAVFNELGVPGAASLYQGDADPAKAKEWVDKMRSTFGGTSQGTPDGTPPADAQPEPTGLPASMQAQMDAFTQAGQQGQPLGGFEQAVANVGDANDLQSLLNAMNFQR